MGMEVPVAYVDFEDTQEGRVARKAFWTSSDGIALIAGFRREGMPLETIAETMIGISSKTLSNWRCGHPDLEAAIRQTDQLVNAMVEGSLLKRALGYEADEVVEELVEGEMRPVRIIHRHVPADTKAALAWLYSRRSDRWRAQQDPPDSSEEIEAVRDIMVRVRSAAALPAADSGV